MTVFFFFFFFINPDKAKNGSFHSADSILIWQDAEPCSPFRHFVCALQLFRRFICIRRSFPTLFICSWWPFLLASLCVCVCVYKSFQRLLKVGTQKVKKGTKIVKKINSGACHHFQRIRFIIR